MARAIWSGVLTFGLVSVPVELYSAPEAHGPVFHQFEKGTADRIRYQRVNERTTDEVGYSDIVKGAETGGGHYVMLDQDEPGRHGPGSLPRKRRRLARKRANSRPVSEPRSGCRGRSVAGTQLARPAIYRSILRSTILRSCILR
jgi:hypothetical protein